VWLESLQIYLVVRGSQGWRVEPEPVTVDLGHLRRFVQPRGGRRVVLPIERTHRLDVRQLRDEVQDSLDRAVSLYHQRQRERFRRR
jgi:hypothetical protein